MLYNADLVEQIVLNLPNYVFWKDTESIYRGCNYNFSKLLGLASPDKIIGYTDNELPWLKKEATNYQAEDKKIFETGKSIIGEKIEADIDGVTRVYLLDKSPTFHREEGVITGILGVLVDITESEKQKTELQQSIRTQKEYVASLNERVTGQLFHDMSITEYTNELTHYLQSIIAFMPGNVYWLNKNCILLGGNNNLAKMFGLESPSELVGLTYDQMSSLAHWMNGEGESFKQAEIEVMSTGIPRLNVEEPPVTINGEARYYMSNKVPLYNNKNEIIGVLGISVDITEQKLLQKKLEGALATKTEFLANMSHDMKSPLAGIVTTADIIAYDEAAPERDQQLASIISASGKQLESFFTSCLDLSKMETQEWTSKKVVFSIKKLIEDVQALFLPKALSSQLSLTIDYDEALAQAVEGNRDSLYRVLLNLVGNAIKFTKQGGVVLRAKKIRQTEDRQLYVEFQIQDTGMGIPEDKYKEIFEKLHRLTPSYGSQIEGSGIGLYIVDQYVKRLGGDIQVKSKLGEGSTFTVSLPLKVASDTNLPQTMTEHSAPVIKKSPVVKKITATPSAPKKEKAASILAHILLVEDTEMIQVVTKILLEESRFSVDIASSGEEALKLFEPGKYGLIYMDIGLPEMNGYETTKAIRIKEESLHAKTKTPIVALTGHGAVNVQKFCGDAEMQGVLGKPLSREQAEKVWQYFGEKLAIEVPGLTLLSDSTIAQGSSEKNEHAIPVVDFAATVELVGSEARAKKLYSLLVNELTKNYLPQLGRTVKQQDYTELRKHLHSLIGALCYAKAPRLNHALLELQAEARNASPTIITAYEHVKAEVEEFSVHHKQLEKEGKM